MIILSENLKNTTIGKKLEKGLKEVEYQVIYFKDFKINGNLDFFDDMVCGEIEINHSDLYNFLFFLDLFILYTNPSSVVLSLLNKKAKIVLKFDNKKSFILWIGNFQFFLDRRYCAIRHYDELYEIIMEKQNDTL